jgi:hypothetical protein
LPTTICSLTGRFVSGVFSIFSLKLKWIVATIALSVLGFSLLLHGGVNLDSAIYANETSWMYQLECYLGWALMWPIAVYGVVHSYLTDSHSLGLEVWFVQPFGYSLLYFVFTKWRCKKHQK